MKLKLYACLVVAGALVAATSAVAAPSYMPFLSVDVNGASFALGQSTGPTEAGFHGWTLWEAFDPFDPNYNPAEDWGNTSPVTKTFSTSKGDVTATLLGVVPNSFRGARNRGANAGVRSSLDQDFVFSQRGVDGFGQTYTKITLSGPGIMPNTVYEFTGHAREPFNGGTDSFQGWVDRARLGGLDGPGPWMDANFGAGSLYQPAAGGVNNPIPTFRRSPISGPDPVAGQEYLYSATFNTTSDANGVITVYTWADPNSYSGTQTATLLNGFELGCTPEPTSLVMFLLGLAGVAGFRRRG